MLNTTTPERRPAKLGDYKQMRVAARRRQMLRKIGERFREARELAGLDQTEASAAFGYANSTQLCLWERGERPVPLDVIVKASRLYGVAVDYLFAVEDDPDRGARQAQTRALTAHVRLFMEAAAQDVLQVIQSRQDAEPTEHLVSELLWRADAALKAFEQFRAANPSAFDNDMRGSAWLARTAGELADAVEQLTAARARQERAQQLALTRRQQARAGATSMPALASSTPKPPAGSRCAPSELPTGARPGPDGSGAPLPLTQPAAEAA